MSESETTSNIPAQKEISLGNFPGFIGDCHIQMASGEYKPISSIRRGDILYGGSRVGVVMYTPVNKELEMVCFDNGLKVMPYHAVMPQFSTEWTFANMIGSKTTVFVEGLYNLVLDPSSFMAQYPNQTEHCVTLNGYCVGTLGNTWQGCQAIYPYFGSQVFIEDLMRHSDWNSDVLTVNPEHIVRNPDTDQIERIMV